MLDRSCVGIHLIIGNLSLYEDADSRVILGDRWVVLRTLLVCVGGGVTEVKK